MFLRLLHLTINPDASALISKFYSDFVIPRLADISGCLHASLIRDVENPDEVISMTMWDSKEHAEAYEKSGLFQELMGQANPLLADASEWKLQLTEDLSLDYAPVQEDHEPLVYNISTQMTPEENDRRDFGQMFVRMVSIKVETGQMDKFQKIYNDEIIPELQKINGCRYAYLSRDMKQASEAISVTIWDNKHNADNYEQTGKYAELLSKLEPTFSRLYQWKMTLEKDSSSKLKTSDDIQVSKYGIVSGKQFE